MFGFLFGNNTCRGCERVADVMERELEDRRDKERLEELKKIYKDVPKEKKKEIMRKLSEHFRESIQAPEKPVYMTARDFELFMVKRRIKLLKDLQIELQALNAE